MPDPRPHGPAHHPVVAEQLKRRADDRQLRIADIITRFAGSMPFVYWHIAIFATWMLLLEPSPWPRLTLAVSLEAIFLSTFVMIGQNRQAAFQQAKADDDFRRQEAELTTNTELTRAIEVMTSELHDRLLGGATTAPERSATR
ncbi:DUF1003 domain-containing protein [Cellulomonas sp. ICMP 17802]|uniref:DUF1003 domain-containing protein n=1 Tax=Cellulomonas sp. ICMP 17802 TaxID=3239199 RepID=UPI00351B8498